MINFHDSAFYESLRVTRRNAIAILDKYSEAQLRTIPEGFGNNILWNIGHMLTSQQLLCYAMAALPLHIPDHYAPMFRKGTNPKDWQGAFDIGELKGLLASTITDLEKDYAQGKFSAYKPYNSSFGVALNSIEDAILFNHIHEGLHFGAIMALQKRV